MIFFLFGLTVLWLGVKVWEFSPYNPQQSWPLKNSTGNIKKSRDFFSVWRHLSHYWWAQPGSFIKLTSVKAVVSQLPQSFLPLTQTEFLALKQVIWSLGFLSLLVALWITDISLKSVGICFLILWVIIMSPDLYGLHKTLYLQRLYQKEVPYFLDLLTLTLQGGGNLEQALLATTKNYQSQLSLVIARKLKELNWGRSLEAVFKDLSLTIKDDDFQYFLTSVIRVKKLGVSLSQTLIIQSELLRTRRRQKAEELSRTAAVKISIPLVLFIFPALLIIYIGPGILQLLNR